MPRLRVTSGLMRNVDPKRLYKATNRSTPFSNSYQAWAVDIKKTRGTGGVIEMLRYVQRSCTGSRRVRRMLALKQTI